MSDPQFVIESLRQVEGGLTRIESEAKDLLHRMEIGIGNVFQRLDDQLIHLEMRLETAQAELAECESDYTVDEDGNIEYPDCSGYAYQVSEIESDILRVHRYKEMLDALVINYRSQSSYYMKTVEQTIPASLHFVRQREEALVKFNTGSTSVTQNKPNNQPGLVDHVKSKADEVWNFPPFIKVRAVIGIGMAIGGGFVIPVTDVESQIEHTEKQVSHLAKHEKSMLEKTHDNVEQTEWGNSSNFLLVDLNSLPNPDLEERSDFHKVSLDDMKSGVEKLETILPLILDGEGFDSQYWSERDKHEGLEYSQGYQVVFDAFFGQDPIYIDTSGDNINIINGRHRIWVAKQLGLESIPVVISDTDAN